MAMDSISNFVKGNFSTYGLDTNLNNYVRNMLPDICDATERSRSFEVPSGYAVTIAYSSPNIGNKFIKASMPKQISITLASNWAPIFGNNTTSPLVDTAWEAINGYALTTNQNKSILRWSGTSPLKLPLELNLIANNKNDVKKKIYEPIIDLAKLVLPQTSALGYYTPPGPYPIITLKSGVQLAAGDVSGVFSLAGWGGTKIDIKIGDYMFLSNVIIERAQITLPSILGNINEPDNVLDLNNINTKSAMKAVSTYLFGTSTKDNMKLAPMRATINLGISTTEALTADSLVKMFSSFESGFDTQKLADGVETSGGTRSSYYRSSGGQS